MRAAALITVVLLAGCASGPLPELKPATPYDPADYLWAKGSGPNSIVGSVWTTLPNGQRKTCQTQVIIEPAGPHFDEVMALRYGSTQRGYIRDESRRDDGPRIAFDWRVQEVWRKIRCGPDGSFEAHGLPDGAYYVRGGISWPLPYLIKDIYTGSDSFMQRVEVAGGQVARVELHP